MATLFHTTGIVLSRRDHREADRWYSAFTREHGKVEFLARGSHKPLAKLSPHLEMPAESEFLLVDGRAFLTVAGVERLRAFPNVYGDTQRLVLAKNALHLVDIGTKPDEADPTIYELIVNWFSFLDDAPSLTAERSGFVLGAFAMKLLAVIGYRPELTRCLSCKTDVKPDAFRWHASKGGVVCLDCCTKYPETWFAARPLSVDALKLVRFALVDRFEEHLRPALPGDTLAEFHEAVESLIIAHFPTIPANSLRAACVI